MSHHSKSKSSLLLSVLTGVLLLAGCGNKSESLSPASVDGQTTIAQVDRAADTSSENPPPSVTKDTQAPTITLDSPKDGDIIKGKVSLKVTATDAGGISSVQFFWDSEPIGVVSKSPYSFDWDTTKHSDGAYTLTAVATDMAGNKKTSAPVVVDIANTQDPGMNPNPTPVPTPPATGKYLKVPQSYGTIQSAVNAAQNGDVVLLSPGTYSGGIVISNKAVTIASLFLTTGDRSYVDQTIVTGGAPIIAVQNNAANSRIYGLHLKAGTKGVQAFARIEVLFNNFDNVGSDQLSFERAGGVVRGNRFFSASDDAIDMDGPLDVLVEDNVLLDSGDDGIEIRNFTNSGADVSIVIRNNTIDGSGEDGVQIIDYSGTAHRSFVIERNLITNSADAGLGLMDNGETLEDFRAANIPENVRVINNTFSGNRYGITGGANMVAVNNIIANCSAIGLKGMGGQSTATHNLFASNGTNFSGSNVDAANTFTGDPLFTSDFHLRAGSAAIDRGVSTFSFGGAQVVNIPASAKSGTNPDLGRYEFGL